MKNLSLEGLAAAAWAVARRFPLTLACAAAVAVAAMTGLEGPAEENVRVGVAAALGLPLFTGLTLLAERRGLAVTHKWAVLILGLAVIGLFYWRWPTWGESGGLLRFFHLNATLHLAVAFVAYAGVPERNGFWQFNRTLFFRFCLGGAYSGAFFVGLALALAAVDNLIGIDVDDLAYPRLFFLMAFVFQTWFFLAGVPDDFEALEQRRDYPKGLRLFAQYVLLPLVGVYLLILTVYFGRIVVTTSWPSGWIGYLVSALAVFGIFSLLMTHPVRGASDQAWVETYARVFWIGILPSAGMLLLAVWQRIGQYGLTERRYLLAVLAAWLGAIALYYTITRSRRIKIIPLSLAFVGALAFVGPWSATAAGERSQTGRLEQLLTTHGVLQDGQIASPETGAGATEPTEVPQEDWRQINDILRYLVEWHGTGSIDAWFEDGLASVDTIAQGTEPSSGGQVTERTVLIAGHFGLVPSDELVLDARGRVRIARADDSSDMLSVAGFEQVIVSANLLDGGYLLADDSLTFAATPDSSATTVRVGGQALGTTSFADVIAQARESGTTTAAGHVDVPPGALWFEVTGDELEVRVLVAQLVLENRDGALRAVSARGTVLLRPPGGEP